MSGHVTRHVLAVGLTIASLLPCAPVHAQTAPIPPSTATVRGVVVRYDVEYWIRASRIDDFDFDGTTDDGLNFGWHRIKPFLSVQKGWLELTLQGQDSRSYGVPELNPNGTSSFATRTSELDFV